MKNRLWPISSRIIEHEKLQRTTYKGPQGNLTINVEVIRPFLHDPRGCWKHKFLKKKAIFLVKKRFSPISSRIIVHNKLPEKPIRVHKVTWHLMLKLKDHFFRTQEVAENINLWKKGNHSSEDKVLTYSLLRIIECDNPPGTIQKGPKRITTITVEAIRSFF